MSTTRKQLELVGLEEALHQADGEGSTPAERRRLRRRVELTHDLLSELPTPDDLAFLHSGLCQTCLPHSRPAQDSDPWERRSGRFSLIVTPGVVRSAEGEKPRYVGVPYGARARLIMIHLQTEGVRSRTVSLGPSLAAFLRSLGLPRTGGPRGSIAMVREQCLRIARCSFTLQWTESRDGADRQLIQDERLVEGLEMWSKSDGEWSGTVQLSARFHEHLREHAVPLDKRGIAHLAGNSFGLDLYALMAYRLPKIDREMHLRWSNLQTQIGAEYACHRALARRVREVMPDVLTAYPQAKVDVTSTGLTLRPSPSAVPRTMVNGYRLASG